MNNLPFPNLCFFLLNRRIYFEEFMKANHSGAPWCAIDIVSQQRVSSVFRDEILRSSKPSWSVTCVTCFYFCWVNLVIYTYSTISSFERVLKVFFKVLFISSASACLDAFEPVTLQELKGVIDRLKLSFCLSDLFNPRFKKLIIDSTGPGLVSLVNKWLQNGSVPANSVTPWL